MSPTKKSGAAPADKAIIRPCPPSLAPGDTSSATSAKSNSAGKLGSPKKDKASIIATNSAKITQDKVFKRDPAEKGKTKLDLNTKKSGSNIDNTTEEDYVTIPGATGGNAIKNEPGRDDNSDNDFMDFGSDADDCEDTSAGKKLLTSPKKPKKSGPPDPNGRVVGRKLVMWHRPRMVEKLVMHTQFECHRAGLKIPWDKIVERLSPGSSGFAALQHLNKLRDILVTEGHMVPPLLGKKSVPHDPTVRGYIRDMDAEKPTDTRVVRWGEKIEDRKENLVVEGIIRGSGNYRRGIAKAIEKTIKASGIRRNRLPSELQDARKPMDAEGLKAKGKKNKNASKKDKRSAGFSSVSPDLAELDSEDEYDPAARKKGKYGLRKVPKRANKCFDDFSDDGAIGDVDELNSTAVAKTPPGNRLKASVGLVTLPFTLPVKLFLRPEILARFPAGPSFIKEINEAADAPNENECISAVEQGGDEIELDYENGADGEYDSDSEDEYDEDPEEYARYLSSQQPLAPIDPRVKEYLVSYSYQGIETHGTLAQYRQALQNGDDPRINGTKYKLLLVQQAEKAGLKSKDLNFNNDDMYAPAHPPVYNSSPAALGQSNSTLAGTSAAAFTTSSGGFPTASDHAMNFDPYNQSLFYSGEYSAQLDNSYSGYNNHNQTIGNNMFSTNDGLYTAGSNIFQTGSDFFQAGSESFDTSGMTYANNSTVNPQFGMGSGSGVDDDLNANFSSVTVNGSYSNDFEVATDNTATGASENLDTFYGGRAVSETWSSPAHYAQYLDDDENKENEEDWFRY